MVLALPSANVLPTLATPGAELILEDRWVSRRSSCSPIVAPSTSRRSASWATTILSLGSETPSRSDPDKLRCAVWRHCTGRPLQRYRCLQRASRGKSPSPSPAPRHSRGNRTGSAMSPNSVALGEVTISQGSGTISFHWLGQLQRPTGPPTRKRPSHSRPQEPAGQEDSVLMQVPRAH